MSDVIDLTNDDSMDQHESGNYDDDLAKAIALSLRQEGSNSGFEDKEHAQQPGFKHNHTASLLGIDRKAMEAERLARLKRKHVVDTTASSTNRSVSPPTKRREMPAGPTTSSYTTVGDLVQTGSSTKRASSGAKILLTSSPSKYSTDGRLESISFADILKPPDPDLKLRSAMLSSFVIDFDWVLPYFDIPETSFIFVLHSFNDEHKTNLRTDFEGLKNVRLVLPPTSGGTMHSKTMLLFFAGSVGQVCRVVVPSANLVPYDWGAGGMMENVLWTIDLPERVVSSSHTNTTPEIPFKQELIAQLNALKVPADVISKLDLFDFGGTKQYRFVHSCAGQHFTDADPCFSTGLLSLSKAIASSDLSTTSVKDAVSSRLDFLTSSLGNLSEGFLQQFVLATRGSTGELCKTHARGKQSNVNKNIKGAKNVPTELVDSKLKIYFPSRESVQKSRGGPSSAGTICFQEKWWNSNEIIRQNLYDTISSRPGGILMHSKILYCRFASLIAFQKKAHSSRNHRGWMYVGSGNFSESAWGRVVVDAKTKKLKLSCRNWESGVLIPAGRTMMTSTPSANPVDKPQIAVDDTLDGVFGHLLRVPFREATRKLVDSDTQPWFFGS